LFHLSAYTRKSHNCLAIAQGKYAAGPRQAGEGISQGDGDSSVCKGCGGYASGFETLVGPKGVRLSGGQLQRAAAARMFVRQPELLV